MRSVKGTFQNGAAQPSEPVAEREGQPVIITFLDEGYASPPPPADDEAWSALAQLVEDCAVETGIPNAFASCKSFVSNPSVNQP